MSWWAADGGQAASILDPLAAGPATGFGANFGASLRSTLAGDTSISRQVGMADAYDPIIARINAGRPRHQQFANPLGRTINDPLVGPTLRSSNDSAALEDLIWRQVEAARASGGADPYPDLPGNKYELLAQVQQRAREAQDQAAEIAGRATTLGTIGSFAGAAAGGLADPPNTISMLLGAPAGASILRTALTEAAINAGATLATRPDVMGYRAELGRPMSAGEVAGDVALAGVAGGALAGGLTAAGRAIGLLRRSEALAAGAEKLGIKKPVDQMSGHELADAADRALGKDRGPDQRAADALVRGAADIAEANPLPDTPAGWAEHTERMSEAADAVAHGEAPRLSDAPVQPITRIEDIAGGRAAFKPGEILTDARTFQFKAGGDAEGVSERLRSVTKWDPELSGDVMVWEANDGRRFIVDGHQRLGLARRMEAAGQDVTLYGHLYREADGISTQEVTVKAAAKNLIQGTGSAIDAAKVFRIAPDVAASLARQYPGMAIIRDGKALASLDPGAFLMIVNGLVPERYGAIVGRLAPGDGELQRAILAVLARAEPENAVQAEAIVRQALAAGTTKEEQLGLFGNEVFTRSLFVERAKVLDKALKTLREDRRIFGLLTREGERIAEAGNVLAGDANAARALDAAQAGQVLQSLANRKGAIADALNAAAARAAADGKYAGAVRDFVNAVRAAVDAGEHLGVDPGRVPPGRSGESPGAEAALSAEPSAAGDRPAAQALSDAELFAGFSEPGSPAAAAQRDWLERAATEAEQAEPDLFGVPAPMEDGRAMTPAELRAAQAADAEFEQQLELVCRT